MTRYAKHVVRVTAGIVLVLVGLVLLPVPILSGWALIIPGLILLADYFPPIRRLLDWAKRKLEEHNVLRK